MKKGPKLPPLEWEGAGEYRRMTIIPRAERNKLHELSKEITELIKQINKIHKKALKLVGAEKPDSRFRISLDTANAELLTNEYIRFSIRARCKYPHL